MTTTELPPQITGDAEALAELDRLADENDGALTPPQVVDAARDPDSALHRHFEWDDSVAAELYRRYQARQFIGTYMIKVNIAPPVRYWVNIVTVGHEYRRASEVARVEEQLAQVKGRLLRDLKRLRDEMAAWEEFANVVSHLSAALEQVRLTAVID